MKYEIEVHNVINVDIDFERLKQLVSEEIGTDNIYDIHTEFGDHEDHYLEMLGIDLTNVDTEQAVFDFMWEDFGDYLESQAEAEFDMRQKHK
ncbi:MAG: hypothetical protein J6Y37_02130 [Paludibacteraceae bacterium]|nr:hypothetical protein [Paludibacteraceae bacterium]